VLSDPGPRWVQYALQTGAAREYINTRLNTTVQATLNLGDVSTLPIPMPPRAVRERVLDILGALDDKIELNRRMSETLESMARELFKSWFVDFDPARAKAEGRAPIGVDAETAKLFPSEFVDSDLGPIPQGWKRSTLSEACQWSRASINPADQPNEQFEHFSIPAFDSGRRPSQDFGSAIKSLKFKVPRESVLVSKLNPAISRVWLPSPRTNRAVCSTEFLVGVTNPPIRQSWLYLFFLSARVREAMIEQASGTSNSHQRVRPVDLDRLAVVVPPAPILSHFDLLVSPLLERVNSSQLDSDLLASIRSALLPRLISGDLSVEGVERALEATA
jgi:type I restriction enzyme S subunit